MRSFAVRPALSGMMYASHQNSVVGSVALASYKTAERLKHKENLIVRTQQLIMAALLLALPANANPEGTQAGALKALAVAKKHNKEIRYFNSQNEAQPELEEKAYCYEGMQLSDSCGDFMKNEPVMVIHDGTKKGKVTEEVIYPVWSSLNHAHVLRSARITRQVPAGKDFTGLDGKKHRQ